jgi:hypothetical protein
VSPAWRRREFDVIHSRDIDDSGMLEPVPESVKHSDGEDDGGPASSDGTDAEIEPDR